MTKNGSTMMAYIKIIPQIDGTINLKNSKNDIVIGNVSVPFLTAAKDVQNAISNGKIINGHIDIAQEYLTYDFLMSNPTKNTFSNVIIDAGNGKVLYTSPGRSINLTQFAIKGFDGMNKDWSWRLWSWRLWSLGKISPQQSRLIILKFFFENINYTNNQLKWNIIYFLYSKRYTKIICN